MTEFYKDKRKKDGLQSICKGCYKLYRSNNKDRITKYYQDNKEKIAEYGIKYRLENKTNRAELGKSYYEANKEAIAKRRKEYYAKNKDVIVQLSAEYYKTNKESILKRNKEWKLTNKDRYSATNKKWRKDNRPKCNAHAAKRRAIKLQATPHWLTDVDLKKIERKYWIADALTEITGTQYHVDHIHPLQGENICGLHVPENLQVITAEENLSKGNKYVQAK